MDFNKIKEAAQNYETDMTKFLREIVKFPGESCGEKDHIERIAEEMRKLDLIKSRSIHREMYSDIWEPERHSSDLMHILTPLVSETVTTGNSIHMKDSNLTQKSEDVVLLISSEVSSLQFTVQGS